MKVTWDRGDGMEFQMYVRDGTNRTRSRGEVGGVKGRSLLGVGPEQHEGWPFTDRENCRSNSGGHVDGQISASRAQGRAWIHMLDFFFFWLSLTVCGISVP